MKVTRLTLHGFTVFSDAVFEFAPGVNVLIGENGTGKSHVLKLIYALSRAARHPSMAEDSPGQSSAAAQFLASEQLKTVFKPDELAALVSDRGKQSILALNWDDAQMGLRIGADGAVAIQASSEILAPANPALFIPPREVLSIFPGFAAAWLNRESAFDRTYFDLCIALDLKALRTGGPPNLLEPLERELGGKVVMKDGKFFLRHAAGDREISMVADGDRKLAMIAHLLTNGSIAENTCLLWDEPEANLNPKRAQLMADTIGRLAGAGVQVFLATHDYALASELALKVDTGDLPKGSTAFFGLYRDAARTGVVVERGERLADIQHNSMLDALASLHAREEDAVFASDEADA
jgi:energy-coupling factor transporter ATP-binding protein EcfA2